MVLYIAYSTWKIRYLLKFWSFNIEFLHNYLFYFYYSSRFSQEKQIINTLIHFQKAQGCENVS